MDYPKIVKFKTRLKNILPREGGKNSKDSMIMFFKMKYEEEIMIDDYPVDLIGYMGHLWKHKNIKVILQREEPLENGFNELIKLKGQFSEFKPKEYKDGPAIEFKIVVDFDQDLHADAGYYLFVEVVVEMSLEAPPMNNAPDDIDDIDPDYEDDPED